MSKWRKIANGGAMNEVMDKINKCSKSACFRDKCLPFGLYGVTILYRTDSASVSRAVACGVTAITTQGTEVTSMVGERVSA